VVVGSPRRSTLLLVLLIQVFAVQLVACAPRARSKDSFDVLRTRLRGQSAAEVELLLGPPDSRVRYFLDDERWIWWRYTYLEGSDYAPEVRGRVVHLSVIFSNPRPRGPAGNDISDWTVLEPDGVGYLPAEKGR